MYIHAEDAMATTGDAAETAALMKEDATDMRTENAAAKATAVAAAINHMRK